MLTGKLIIIIIIINESVTLLKDKTIVVPFWMS
jgi:hypothetical protein